MNLCATKDYYQVKLLYYNYAIPIKYKMYLN